MSSILDDMRKERHADWNAQNLTVLRASGLPFRETPHKHERKEACLFREPGMPKVDFYPSTGRWRIVDKASRSKTLGGGARSFLRWYEKLRGERSWKLLKEQP